MRADAAGDAAEPLDANDRVVDVEAPAGREIAAETSGGGPLSTSTTDVGAESAEIDDCPLCLLPLESYDRAHPLQCPSRRCHFNFCEGIVALCE